MLFNSILIIIGFILLIKGSDFLVEGASKIAKKFNIPEMVIGLTVVAVGTSMPELVVSLTSALEGYSDLAIGNVVGSNISNLFLILGICSIIKPLIFEKETRLVEIPFTIFITILFFYLCINGFDKIITAEEGFILLLICILFISYNLIVAKNMKKGTMIEIQTKDKEKNKLISMIFLIVIGTLSLKFGGDLVVDNIIKIAENLNISEKLISLTVVAFSTSLPELITSISATKKGMKDIAIGNILGSQIFNILLIVGVTSIIEPIKYSANFNENLILLILGTIVLCLFPYIGEKNKMTKSNGVLFIMIYIYYLIKIIFFE